MSILVYRDRDGKRDLVGRIDYEALGGSATFSYDPTYLAHARTRGELSCHDDAASRICVC